MTVLSAGLPTPSEPLVDSSGTISRAWLDFLRMLWLRTDPLMGALLENADAPNLDQAVLLLLALLETPDDYARLI